MKHLYTTFLFVVFCCLWQACDRSDNGVRVTIDRNQIINSGYIGNGAQWDPYQLDYGKGRMTISDADWKKLYDRLDYMRPQFMRVMINTASSVRDGKLEPEHAVQDLLPILEYCQSRNVTVMFGDWGGKMVDSKQQTINELYLGFAAQYVDYLINTKGFSCIKYYNMVNEPNGYWSSTDGSYPLWATAIRYLDGQLQAVGLKNQLSIVGPDAAIWTDREAWWVDSCANQLGDVIGLYDIHTYPSKVTVNSGEYSNIIGAYSKRVPEGKKIVMGEIGFKFVDPADSLYLQENIRRAKAKPYASTDDSQMFVYDYMYGTDMADALFQTIDAGYSGSIVWMLDDAMHSKEAPDELKVWGFWNILGDEYFGAEEEAVRPWYYAWSLLTRYLPAGSVFYQTKVEGNGAVKAITAEANGAYTFALVNVSKQSCKLRLQSSTLGTWSNVKQFVYAEGSLKKDGDHTLQPNAVLPTLDWNGGMSITIPAEALIVYTNHTY